MRSGPGFRVPAFPDQGSHHIFARDGVRELVNLQEVGGQAKPDQVKQLLSLVERYNLSLGGKE